MTVSQSKGIVSFMMVTIMVTVLYAVSGLLCLKLGTGTNDATAIWIPSGIALGAVLVFGLRTFPGIFIGSLLIHYYVHPQAIQIFTMYDSLISGCVISIGSVLQALTGWLLIRRWLGLHDQLNEPNHIILFSVLAGPIACLVSTTIGNITLLLFNILAPSQFLLSWITWYIGDCIGVLIFTPIFLILFAKPASAWRPRILPILVPLCMSFFVICFAYALSKNSQAVSNPLWLVLVSGFLFCALVNLTLFIIYGQKNIARNEYEARLEQMAHFDLLTGLPNRFSFIDKLKKSISHAEREKNSLSLIFIGIDNFKNLNDTLGHAAGDIALQSISYIIADIIDDGDYFARVGGDEFGILLVNKNEREVELLLAKLLDDTNHSMQINDTVVNLTVSVGIANFPDAGVNAEEIIKNAGIAMYHAKELGKNTSAHFSDELNKVMKRLRMIELELRHAILRNELILYYQPQVDIHTDKIIGIEVLLRWYSPVFGFVPPGEFIPLAERNGLIHAIGEWVLQQLTLEYPAIHAVAPNSIKVSVNVSTLQLNDTRFYLSLVKALENNPINKMLTLEITETAFIINPRKTTEIMKQIKQLGVEFSLDDFGMNYSSMRYLKSLPISQLKIDYYFIKDITTDAIDAAIVSTIIQLAKGLKLPAIAEGVETREQVDLLNTMCCQYVQGYYFYKPMPLSDLISLL